MKRVWEPEEIPRGFAALTTEGWLMHCPEEDCGRYEYSGTLADIQRHMWATHGRIIPIMS